MIPEPPIRISEDAKRHWANVFNYFSEFTTLKNADLFLIARYSEAAAEYEYLAEKCAGKDCFITLHSAKGGEYTVYDPNFIRLEKISAQMLRMEKQLGLGRKDSGNKKAMGELAERGKLFRAK